MYCPRCKAQLAKEVIDEVTIEFEVFKCQSCQGLWFEKRDDLEKIEKITEPLLVEFRHVPSLDVQMIPLTCPSCNNFRHMDKVENSRDSKVIMDVCSSCFGVWLDKGELQAIQQESWSSILTRLYGWLKQS